MERPIFQRDNLHGSATKPTSVISNLNRAEQKEILLLHTVRMGQYSNFQVRFPCVMNDQVHFVSAQ